MYTSEPIFKSEKKITTVIITWRSFKRYIIVESMGWLIKS